jgi:hypothetical protein
MNALSFGTTDEDGLLSGTAPKTQPPVVVSASLFPSSQSPHGAAFVNFGPNLLDGIRQADGQDRLP